GGAGLLVAGIANGAPLSPQDLGALLCRPGIVLRRVAGARPPRSRLRLRRGAATQPLREIWDKRPGNRSGGGSRGGGSLAADRPARCHCGGHTSPRDLPGPKLARKYRISGSRYERDPFGVRGTIRLLLVDLCVRALGNSRKRPEIYREFGTNLAARRRRGTHDRIYRE